MVPSVQGMRHAASLVCGSQQRSPVIARSSKDAIRLPSPAIDPMRRLNRSTMPKGKEGLPLVLGRESENEVSSLIRRRAPSPLEFLGRHDVSASTRWRTAAAEPQSLVCLQTAESAHRSILARVEQRWTGLRCPIAASRSFRSRTIQLVQLAPWIDRWLPPHASPCRP
jgi:hypothetical protein